MARAHKDWIKIRGSDYIVRASNPEKDLEWAYGLFKSSLKPYIEDMLGEWPEEHQFNFFKSGFQSRPISIIEHEERSVACYAIDEETHRVTVQRLYIAEDYQGKGIGRWVIDQGVQKSHQVRKPFLTEVLDNNASSIAFYKAVGFDVVGQQNDPVDNQPGVFITQHVICHRDTLIYQ